MDDGQGIEVACARCTVALLEVTEFELLGTTPQERVGYMVQLAVRRGWRVEGTGANVPVVCPACQALEHGPPRPLPPYDSRARCPKCGDRRVSTRYDNGCTPLALAHAEHLARRCGRCGYEWPQACKAPNQTPP